MLRAGQKINRPPVSLSRRKFVSAPSAWECVGNIVRQESRLLFKPRPAEPSRPTRPGAPPPFDLGELRLHPREHNEATIRSLCQNAYLGDGTALCRVLGRYKMFVDTADTGLSSHLLLDGYWEMWVTEALLGFVRQGMVAVDVGANLGYFTLLLADLCGSSGTVHAFEPNPAIGERLRRTVAVNGFAGRTHVHGVPLSDQDGLAVELVVPRGEPKNGHIVAAGHAGDEPSVALTTRRLDTVAGLERVDFVKIDAEGAEEGIWRGMRAILDRRQPLTIFLEYTRDRYADPRGFLDEIVSGGFALAVIDPFRGVEPVTVDHVLAGPGDEDWMLVFCR